MDLKSWCRSSGATMGEITTTGTLHRVLVFPKGVARDMMQTTEKDLQTAARLAAGPGAVGAAGPEAPATSAATARPEASEPAPTVFAPGTARAQFDLSDLPGGALDEELSQIGRLRPGTGVSLQVAASEGQRVVRWCAAGGHELLAYTAGGRVDLVLGRRAETAALVPASSTAQYECALMVMHNDLESLLGALLVANSAAAQGMRTMVFFSFWGLNLLRADRPNLAAPAEPVSFMQRMFKWMMPKGPRRQNLGQLNFGGAGAIIMQNIMQEKNIQGLPSLLAAAEEQGVDFVACTMSMPVMGITRRDLQPHRNLHFGGVATFVEVGRHAQLSLVF
jgi:peroxiredoxin family protein